MGRCMEVVWHGPGQFSHTGTPTKDWQAVLDKAAAIRLLEEVAHLKPWSAIYEVDLVEDEQRGGTATRTTQYLVAETTGGQDHGR